MAVVWSEFFLIKSLKEPEPFPGQQIDSTLEYDERLILNGSCKKWSSRTIEFQLAKKIANVTTHPT
jgi:hypothetical protein